MLLGYTLYGIALILFIYIIVNLIRTRTFDVSDAIAALGIVVTIILAQRISLPLNFPPLVGNSTPSPTSIPDAQTACIPDPKSPTALAKGQSILSSLISNAEVVWSDDFECNTESLGYGWGRQIGGSNTSITASSGKIIISAQKGDNAWDGIFRLSDSIKEGYGALVLFRYSAGTVAPLFIDSGEWETLSYRGWGISINEDNTDSYVNSWEGWSGTTYFGQEISAVLKSGSWYYFLIKVEKDGMLLTQLWEKDNLNNQTEHLQLMGATWEGVNLKFFVQVHDGSVEIDDYQEFISQ